VVRKGKTHDCQVVRMKHIRKAVYDTASPPASARIMPSPMR
jgi:hypothetical protein